MTERVPHPDPPPKLPGSGGSYEYIPAKGGRHPRDEDLVRLDGTAEALAEPEAPPPAPEATPPGQPEPQPAA